MADTKSEPGKRKKKILDLNASRVAATAIASITTSIIASRLTTTVNSLIALAIVSVISTLSIEVYSRVLHGTRKVAVKTAALIPYSRILPDGMADSINARLEHALDDTTGSMPTIVGAEPPTADIERPADVDSPATAAGDDAAALVGPDGAAALVEAETTTGDDDDHGARIGRITQTVLLFVVVALMTILGSGIVSSMIQKPTTETNVYPRTSLSTEDTRKIIDSASAAAADKVNAAQSTTDARVSALSDRISALESKLDSLESAASGKPSTPTASASPSPSASASPPASSTPTQQPSGASEADLEALRKQVNDLKAEVDELKAAGATSTETQK
jgi:uncharacterized protein YceH (UPF0502 family)